MRYFSGRVVGAASLCLALGVGATLLAQKTPSPGEAEASAPETKFTTGITDVNVLFTVTDKKGRFVTDLTVNDFEVSENKKPQFIQQFTAESDLPLRLALLIDTSNSIRSEFRFEQQAAIRFMNDVMRPRQDRMLLLSFDSSPELQADLTSDMTKLEEGINSMRPGGGTALYDGIYFAAKQKLMLDQPREKFRRAMIIISDGEDTQSRYTRDQALEAAQLADTVIYAISTNITRAESDGDKVLKYLTEETGGQAFFPFKVEDLDQSFENIANELRHQYNIYYHPDPLKTDGLFHPIQVKVKTRKDLVVRARKGYFAPRL
ncbi:MAG TPA: VWA domain-containing protein [Bryobacteraceae bacterium]|nr:VWA domain-containing protein [Bryobacteraceae bacterium]